MQNALLKSKTSHSFPRHAEVGGIGDAGGKGAASIGIKDTFMFVLISRVCSDLHGSLARLLPIGIHG